MNPLKCDALFVMERSRAERIFRWIPILGWAWAAALYQARVRPLVREVERQLQARSETLGEWSGSTERKAAGCQLCTIIGEAFGWPNDRFLPDDPMRIVFWAHRDGLDGEFALLRIKTTFHVSAPCSALQQIHRHGTLDDLLMLLLSLPKNSA